MAGGVSPTLLPAKWFNTIQRELCHVITKNGGVLNPDDDTQIFEILNSVFLSQKQNGSDIPDKHQFIKNLGLLETVDCAKNALDKRTGGTVNGGVTLGQDLTISWGGRTATYQENGDIHGPFWVGHLSGWVDNRVNGRATWDYVNSTFVKDIRLGHMQDVQIWGGPGYRDESSYVITGVYNGNVDEYVDYVQRRVLQKNVNGNWINVWFM